MRRSRFWFALGGALSATWIAGCVPGEIDAGDELLAGPIDGVVHVVRPPGEGSIEERSFALAVNAPKAIFLNGGGGTYTAGWDDSANHVSSVVQGQGLSRVTIPPVGWSADTWTKFRDCMADEYGRFDINVTDQRPTSGSYIEAVIGGTGSELGYGGGVGGVAPVDTYRCQPIPSAVVFIFAGNTWARNPIVACEIAAQEIGHAVVPLDHEYLASDPMTYLSYSGHKTFQDKSAQCGEYSPRQCFCNRASQNSVQLLLTTLGPKATTPPPTPTPPPPPTPPADTTPPVVTIVSPADGASLAGNTTLSVSVKATDAGGVRDLKLYWTFSNNVLPCNNTSFQGVSCAISGDTATWTIQVGTGDRQFYATASDGAGNLGKSATRLIHLLAATAPPVVNAPPQVRVDGPAAGTTLTAGGPLDIQATVFDDGQVIEVMANWTSATGQVSAFPMHEIATGVYALQTTIASTAPAGARSFTVSATDDLGQKTTSPSVLLMVK